ncbi:prepilin-type N-terminal cleavage/methylation domain-containing protein [Sphingomonas sp. H39-1-10]|uniref:prepilin-type N-terminal cleavage/methylation domain-containing protein n=1 Tax=Sphingomonas pollutisoli TaxID=3030829 RepID=UPI0023B8F7FB|nr:prepilin-type N-terminal cleavage/methylation domain-containing protein [Sphingomonas pollutisoli]MDF0487770.1 prepilin-type N-terminal cleavage/methylation domain-containing protein [Sphingomonas pollutisoli]
MLDSISKRNAARSEFGFTLIEMLVTLALLGFAALLLLQGLAVASNVAERERTQSTDLSETIAAQRVLRSSIERLRPVRRIDSSTPIIEFRGTAGVVTYVGPPLDRDAPDVLQRFRLTRTASGDLVLYSASILKENVDRSGTDLVGWSPNTILHGVTDLEVSYLGAGPNGGERGWQDRWWDRPSPPDLIRIRVSFQDGDHRTWPDLVIRPHATMRAGCRVDVFTGRCEIDQ